MLILEIQFFTNILRTDPLFAELEFEDSMDSDFDESFEIDSCFNEIIAFVQKNQFLR